VRAPELLLPLAASLAGAGMLGIATVRPAAVVAGQRRGREEKGRNGNSPAH